MDKIAVTDNEKHEKLHDNVINR